MNPKVLKRCQLSVRTSKATKDKFVKKAEQTGSISKVLTDLIEAYIEGRISISPKPVLVD